MMNPSPPAKWSGMRHAKALADALLALVMALGLLSWFFDPLAFHAGLVDIRISWGAKPLIAIAVMIIIRTALKIRAGKAGGKPAAAPGLWIRLSFSLGVTLLLLAGLEAALKAGGVPPGEPVFTVRGREGEPIRADGSMISDAELLWRFKPSTQFRGVPVNKAGFLDREFPPVKATNAVRIICLGDSCTAEGYPPYSTLLEQSLQRERPDLPVEVFNLGVHGYSILQGQALYSRAGRSFSPDVVTIFFGWNDHWLTGESDRERMARAGSAAGAAVRNAIARKRITTWLGRMHTSHPDPGRKQLRVPPDEYARALRTLIQDIRADGATPVVLTAPRAEAIHRRLVHGGSARSTEEAAALHDQYAALTRDIARESNTALVDLAANIKAPDCFKDDGIHFTDAGREQIASILRDQLKPLLGAGMNR